MINNRTAGRPVPNAILKAETVHDIFVPALPEKGVKSLSEFMKIEGCSWSTALAVLTTDIPGLRRKGSAGCKFYKSYINYYANRLFRIGGGWASTGYFMDPTTGIAAVFGVQVAPQDTEATKVNIKLEYTLYKGLRIESDEI